MYQGQISSNIRMPLGLPEWSKIGNRGAIEVYLTHRMRPMHRPLLKTSLRLNKFWTFDTYLAMFAIFTSDIMDSLFHGSTTLVSFSGNLWHLYRSRFAYIGISGHDWLEEGLQRTYGDPFSIRLFLFQVLSILSPSASLRCPVISGALCALSKASSGKPER